MLPALPLPPPDLSQGGKAVHGCRPKHPQQGLPAQGELADRINSPLLERMVLFGGFVRIPAKRKIADASNT
jgi:hypothetical protein